MVPGRQGAVTQLGNFYEALIDRPVHESTDMMAIRLIEEKCRRPAGPSPGYGLFTGSLFTGQDWSREIEENMAKYHQKH